MKLNNERNNCIIIFQLLLFLYYLSSSLGKKKYNFEKFYFDAIEIKNCIKNLSFRENGNSLFLSPSLGISLLISLRDIILVQETDAAQYNPLGKNGWELFKEYVEPFFLPRKEEPVAHEPS